MNSLSVLGNERKNPLMLIALPFVAYGVGYFVTDTIADYKMSRPLSAADAGEFVRDEYSSRVIRLCEKSGDKCNKVLFHVDDVVFGQMKEDYESVFYSVAQDDEVCENGDGAARCSFEIIETACGHINYLKISVWAFPDYVWVKDDKLKEDINLNGLFLGPEGFYCDPSSELISGVGFDSTKG